MNIELPRQRLDLSSAIAEGDIRVLLMVLVLFQEYLVLISMLLMNWAKVKNTKLTTQIA